MSIYLHYWYSHFDEDISVEELNSLKRTSLINQLSKFDERKALMTSGSANADKALEMLEDFGADNGNLGGEIGKLLSNVSPAVSSATYSGASVDGQDMSFQSVGNLSKRLDNYNSKAKTAEIKAAIEQIGSQVGDIITEANSILEDLENTLNKHYTIYYQYAMEREKAGALPKGKAKKISTALASGVHFIDWNAAGEKYASSTGKTLAQDYLRLKNRIDALQVYAGKSNLSFNDARNISKIVGKIGGTFSNAGGNLKEVGVAQAINNGERQMKPYLNKTDDYFLKAGVTGGTAGVHFTAEEDLDSAYEQWLADLDETVAGTYNKNDVTILYNDKEVALTIGLTVKNSNANVNMVEKNIKLQDSTPLLNVLQTLWDEGGVTEEQTYNIAAGREDIGEADSKDTYAQQQIWTGESLQQKWTALMQYAVASNFLSFLAGDGSLGSNNLILVVNQEIFSISDVLNAVANNPDLIQFDGGKQRFRFWQQNTWRGRKAATHRSPSSGQSRSSGLVGESGIFSSTTIKAKLQIGLIAAQMGKVI